MTVRHILKGDCYVCQNCGFVNIILLDVTPTCPECGESTNQLLRGWTVEYMKYRCGHCKKTYKIEEDKK